MFKKTDPQQALFGPEASLSPSLRRRLQGSWAHVFKVEVLPILMDVEEDFSLLYGKTGRPNFSVSRMLGLCLLEELNDMSDQEALDAFGFDVRWRYALEIGEEQAYLSRRSLVEFRRRLAAYDPEMELMRGVFEQVSQTAIVKLNLSAKEQRLDSTHLVSNIRIRGRLDLFQNTLKLFLKSLNEAQFKKVPAPIRKWHNRNPEGWFGLGAGERKEKLNELASYLYRLIRSFKKNADVNMSEGYLLLVRLFEEQCDVVEGYSEGKSGKEVALKAKPKGRLLQSPYDPDASYGHKGSGYSAHITETCNNSGKPEIITDVEVHGAHRSDAGKTQDVLDRLENAGIMPETLFVDGGYPTVPSTPKILERGVDLVAPVNRGRLESNVVGRDQFEYDSDGFVVSCPKGYRAIDHRTRSANNGTGRSLYAIFDGDTCRKCPQLDQCPVRTPNHRERGCKARDTIGDFRLEISRALRIRDAMFANQLTSEWKERYKIRAGVEGTMSEMKRSHGLGKLRVRKAPKVRFAVLCKVIACNIKRWAKAHSGAPAALMRLLGLRIRPYGLPEANWTELALMGC